MRSTKYSILVATAALLVQLVFTTHPANAVPIIDQECAPALTDLYSWLPNPSPVVQTFTVGQSGLLSSVEVFAMSTGDVNPLDWSFEIIDTVAGVPQLGASALATFTITFTQGAQDWTPSFYGGDLTSAGLMVTAGQVLGIRCVAGSSSESYYWAGVYATSPYAGGAFYTTGWSGDQYITDNSDMGFRTYVDPDVLDPVPAPVPEPTTILLLGSGLIGFIGFRRGIKK